ncbi:MAG: hypothetical protein IMY79_00825 [Chloroflexi bacterium]|nr:hypothetical protein [Chloroflexota bacterium]
MLKAASIILIIVALSSLVIGIVYVARGTLMPYHIEFIGDAAMEAIGDNPGLAALATVFIRLAGTLFISVGVLLIALIYYGLRKAERWAWWTTLIGMGIVNGPMVAITRPVGGFPWTLAIIMLAAFAIAIGLAAREVFREVPSSSTAGI